jgi:hypothetical protein
MKSKPVLFVAIFLSFVCSWSQAQDQKPNFSGNWVLDKEKSELGPMNGQGNRRPRRSDEDKGQAEGAGEGGERRPRGGMFDSVTIEHNEPVLIIKRKANFRGEEHTQELKYTTDGKKNTNEGFFGMTTESKSHWDGNKLVTDSTAETPRGVMETKEVRSLSADGSTMTVEVTTKGGPREGTRKMVFNKQPSN